uniref:BHLH domain-containing protein n=1 Tax=Panagrellus redivivus TaxID=6233 RepID=A0A7E4USH2_PANRE
MSQKNAKEKLRRNRMNDATNQLKVMVLSYNPTLSSRLDKPDILEQAVKLMSSLSDSSKQHYQNGYNAGFKSASTMFLNIRSMPLFPASVMAHPPTLPPAPLLYQNFNLFPSIAPCPNLNPVYRPSVDFARPVTASVDGKPNKDFEEGLNQDEMVAAMSTHMAAGHSAKLKRDGGTAIGEFSKAVELAVRVYGKVDTESFEPYYQYGSSLLDYAIFKQYIEKLPAPTEGFYAEGHEAETIADTEGVNTAEAGAEEMETSYAVEEKDESTATAIEKENPDEKKESDDATLANTAIEVLKTARYICERQDIEDPKWQRRTASVLGCLGTLSIMTKKFEEAVEDLEQAIKLLKPLEDTDRVISFMYVEVAGSHLVLKQFDKAVENYEAAYALLNARLEAIKDQKDNKDGGPDILMELKGLEVLVKDLKGAIDNAKDTATDAKKKAAKRPPPLTGDTEVESKKQKPDDPTEAAPAASEASPVKVPASTPVAEASGL